MESLSEVLLRTFTRYFMPGLIFLVVALFLPLYLFVDLQVLNNLKLLDFPQIFVFSIVLGYLLDSFGAYRWTLSYRQYKTTRDNLAKELHFLVKNEKSRDPDQYLGELWLKDKDAYDRLFLERAEWVMILESSCALLVGGLVLMTVSVILMATSGSHHYWEMVVGALLFASSYISSSKGVQRMSAHNTKTLVAVRSSIIKTHKSRT